MEKDREMLRRIIFFLIILVYIFVVNAHDFDNLLNHGVNDYFQRFPGVLYTSCVLIYVLLLVLYMKSAKDIRMMVLERK